MNPASRRSFLTLAGASAATVAVATVAAAAPAAAKPVAAAAATPTKLPAGAQGAIVAHVKDVKRGVVSMMVAGHSVDVVDHDLVARLAHAATAAKG